MLMLDDILKMELGKLVFSVLLEASLRLVARQSPVALP